MSVKIDRTIRKKQQEIADFKAQIEQLQLRIRDATTYIQAMEDSKRMHRKDDGTEHEAGNEAPVTLKDGSALALARDIILMAGKPLHVDEILRQMGKDVNKKTRTSLAGSLAGYARDKRVFEKTGANTFGVLGMDLIGNAPEDETKPQPPLSLVGGSK
jgi:hypothetical protein